MRWRSDFNSSTSQQGSLCELSWFASCAAGMVHSSGGGGMTGRSVLEREQEQRNSGVEWLCAAFRDKRVHPAL